MSKEYIVKTIDGKCLNRHGRDSDIFEHLMSRRQAIFVALKHGADVYFHPDQYTMVNWVDPNFPCPLPCALWRESMTLKELKKLVKQRQYAGCLPGSKVRGLGSASRKPQVIVAMAHDDELFGWYFEIEKESETV